VEAVLKEINGYEVATGRPVSSFSELKADGSTASGCWIYAGCYADGVNQTRRRNPADPATPNGWINPEWGWAWPANRRVLYNRASADPQGRPWSERKKLIWWDDEAGKWTGFDVPDFPPTKRPDYVAPDDAEGMDAISGDDPFIMMGDGRAWLYSPSGLLDGPLPTHYEPIESPVENLLYPKVGANPAAITWKREDNPLNPASPEYPIAASTFRLTEHHTTGPMSRNLPWLAELQPEMFVEIDRDLARERGIEDGGWMTVMTERGEMECKAKVTNRIRPMKIGGRTVHQISIPWHWGGLTTSEQGVTGDSLNDLVVLSGDPNTSIEDKTFSCNVRAGRRQQQTTERLAHASKRPVAPDEEHEAEQPDKLYHTHRSGHEPPPETA
jgi:formate dehydrogenase major subunit